MSGYPQCKFCGHFLRPLRSLATDHPGTVSRANPDTCRPCFKSGGVVNPDRKKPGDPSTRYHSWPKPCRGCDKPLRPGKSSLAEWPETLRSYGNGMCGACYYAHKKKDATP